MDIKQHNENVVSQFSNQAKAYSTIQSHNADLDRLIKISKAGPNDNVLDIACGSGIVACEFARHTAHVTGIDMTMKMIEVARTRQTELGLNNVTWEIGDVNQLPFPENYFTIVTSRFGFHHFQDPGRVMAEMKRVCKQGGKVLIADVALPESQLVMYNSMEKLRDDSHVAALSPESFISLLKESGFAPIKTDDYIMKIELEEQMQASFPGDELALRKMIVEDIGINKLGINVSDENGRIWLNYPIHLFAGTRL